MTGRSVPDPGDKAPPENEFEELRMRSPAENPFLSNEDDLSDVSVYHQRKNPSSVTDYTLVDVTDGPKTVLNIPFSGHNILTTAGDAGRIGPVTIDGTANDYSSPDNHVVQDSAGDYVIGFGGLPFRYDSSLKVEWEQPGTGHYVVVDCYILGSGPHTAAVVRDGEPVYMTAQNLSEETIEEMNVPKGYKIVRNPDITHPNPQSRGMWDDDKEKVVDHPYFKVFHDTLDKLNGMRRRVGSRNVLERIEKNPPSYENVLEGENPMEDPVEEAVQFWYEREQKRSTELKELEELRS